MAKSLILFFLFDQNEVGLGFCSAPILLGFLRYILFGICSDLLGLCTANSPTLDENSDGTS